MSFFFFAVTLTPAAATGKAELDGKTYKGEMAKKGETSGDADEFVFKKGTFRSTACDQYGFTGAPYSVEKKDGKEIFTAVTTNDKGEKLSWTGSVEGKAISGEAIYMTSSGSKEQYWFKGTLETN